jgi:hypothetical protein
MTLDSSLHEFIQAFSAIPSPETSLHEMTHGIRESSGWVCIVNRLQQTQSENLGFIPGRCGLRPRSK